MKRTALQMIAIVLTGSLLMDPALAVPFKSPLFVCNPALRSVSVFQAQALSAVLLTTPRIDRFVGLVGHIRRTISSLLSPFRSSTQTTVTDRRPAFSIPASSTLLLTFLGLGSSRASLIAANSAPVDPAAWPLWSSVFGLTSIVGFSIAIGVLISWTVLSSILEGPRTTVRLFIQRIKTIAWRTFTADRVLASLWISAGSRTEKALTTVYDRYFGARGALSPSLVLVVDDDADQRKYLRNLLELSGFKVVEAANGLEGLAVFQSQRPSVVVSDAQMPQKDGPSLLADIYKIDTRVKLILVTSNESIRIQVEENQGYVATVSKVQDFNTDLDPFEDALLKHLPSVPDDSPTYAYHDVTHGRFIRQLRILVRASVLWASGNGVVLASLVWGDIPSDQLGSWNSVTVVAAVGLALLSIGSIYLFDVFGAIAKSDFRVLSLRYELEAETKDKDTTWTWRSEEQSWNQKPKRVLFTPKRTTPDQIAELKHLIENLKADELMPFLRVAFEEHRHRLDQGEFRAKTGAIFDAWQQGRRLNTRQTKEKIADLILEHSNDVIRFTPRPRNGSHSHRTPSDRPAVVPFQILRAA